MLLDLLVDSQERDWYLLKAAITWSAYLTRKEN